MSKRKQATLGEFGFSKKVCQRDGEVDVIIPEFVEEKEIVKRIQCLHCSDKFVKKNFSLRLFLNCSYFSSDFSLNVLIKFVLIKKRVYAQARLFRHLTNQNNCWSRFAFLKKHQIPSRSSKESFSGNSVKISDCRAFSLRI